MEVINDWDNVRTNYQLLKQHTYFNSASFGALSNETVDAQKQCLEGWQMHGNMVLNEAHEAADYIRKQTLNLLNARDHQSAVIADVSTGMNLLAEALSHKRKIVLFEKDYPAVNLPWLGRNFDVQWVPRENYDYDLTQVEEILKKGVDLLAVSWVMFNSGLRLDIKSIGELCKKYHTTFIVDATQGLGAQALDLNEVHVDVLLCSCFKWFLAGYGTCMMVCKNSFVEAHPIQAAGQYTILDVEKDLIDTNNHRQGITRFELGHMKILPVFALQSSLKALSAIGFSAIQERTGQLMQLACDGFEKSGIEILTPQERSNNIVMIEGTTERIEKLKRAEIVCTHRNGLIRFGIYFYNNEEDIARLIKALN